MSEAADPDLWTCRLCGEEVDGDFDVCWQCGATKDGVVDPEFTREPDAATLPPGWVPGIECSACGYRGKVLFVHRGYQWWMFPLSLAIACTILGAVPWFLFLLILGNSTYRACPRCGARTGLEMWNGDPSPEADDLWRRAKDEDERKFRRNKFTLLAIVLVIFAVVIAAVLTASNM